MKPFCEATDRNKAPILAVLREEFAGVVRVLEIGSGTGQHAAHFCEALAHLHWQPTDLAERLPDIRAWRASCGRPGFAEPVALDVTEPSWPALEADAAFSANTAHIMPLAAVEAMFRGLGRVLGVGGVFCLYGPFGENGRHTGPGNERFDASLRARDYRMGIRDVGELESFAVAAGFELARRHVMPADNRILVWQRT